MGEKGEQEDLEGVIPQSPRFDSFLLSFCYGLAKFIFCFKKNSLHFLSSDFIPFQCNLGVLNKDRRKKRERGIYR